MVKGVKTMPKRLFEHLRDTPWEPSFRLVTTLAEASTLINRPHEDYPYRVEATTVCIEWLLSRWSKEMHVGQVNISVLRKIHATVFSGSTFAGLYRNETNPPTNVVVSEHTAPHHSLINFLLTELELFLRLHPIKSIEDLRNWYWDFETIHPFRDGNGRVGGIIVAAYSHQLPGDHNGKYLAVEQ